jgi:hypothetical protein
MRLPNNHQSRVEELSFKPDFIRDLWLPDHKNDINRISKRFTPAKLATTVDLDVEEEEAIKKFTSGTPTKDAALYVTINGIIRINAGPVKISNILYNVCAYAEIPLDEKDSFIKLLRGHYYKK